MSKLPNPKAIATTIGIRKTREPVPVSESRFSQAFKNNSCPKCGAQPGHSCVSTGRGPRKGTELSSVHNERLD